MTVDNAITRRTALAAGATALGTVALTACSSDSTSATTNPSDSTTPSGSTTPAAGTKSSAGAKPIVALASIKIGEAVAAKLPDGSDIIVARPTSSTAVAFSRTCTHRGCPVNPDGAKLKCPCHHSEYNALTGKVLQGPAPAPLPTVVVHVVGGQVLPGT